MLGIGTHENKTSLQITPFQNETNEKKTGLNSLKPVCYKNAQDFITGPPFCPVPTLLQLILRRNRFYNF